MAYGETRWLICTSKTENCPIVKFYVRMHLLFLKFLSSSGVFLTFLSGFSISKLVYVEDVFNVNTFLKSKYKCEYKRLFI